MPNNISDRLAELAKSNLLPDIKYTRNFEVIIRKGIVTELYSHGDGVTRDQLPNLKTLADYMKASYRKAMCSGCSGYCSPTNFLLRRNKGCTRIIGRVWESGKSLYV